MNTTETATCEGHQTDNGPHLRPGRSYCVGSCTATRTAEGNKTMDAIELVAREAGTYESALTYLAGLVDEDHVTDAEFRALARRELEAIRRRIAELRGELADEARTRV